MIEKTKFWEKTKAACKPAGKSVLAVAVGVALLAGSYGALAGFTGGFSLAPEGTQIESGALQLNVTEAGWTKNGVAVPEDQLGAVALVPGDRIEYSAKAAAMHTGVFTSYLHLQEAEKIAGSLTDDSQATITYSVDGQASGVKTITPELAGTRFDAGFSLTVAPGAKQGLSLDLSQIKVAASMVKPDEAAPAPKEPDFDIFAWDFGAKSEGAEKFIKFDYLALSTRDLEAGKVVPLGTKIIAEIEYTGSDPAIDFSNPPQGMWLNEEENRHWEISAGKNRMTATFTSDIEEPDVFAMDFKWRIDPSASPQPEDLRLSVSVQGPANADFPEGLSIPSSLCTAQFAVPGHPGLLCRQP